MDNDRIQVAGSIIPDKFNAPLDARTRINVASSNLTEISEAIIQLGNPFVGQLVYNVPTKLFYLVKEVAINSLGDYTIDIEQYTTGGSSSSDGGNTDSQPNTSNTTITDYSDNLETESLTIESKNSSAKIDGLPYKHITATTSSLQNITKPIQVKKGDKIVYTGLANENAVAVVQYDRDSVDSKGGKILINPKHLLDKTNCVNITGNTYLWENKEITVTDDGTHYIRCCAYKEGEKGGAPKMKVILYSSTQSSGSQEGEQEGGQGGSQEGGQDTKPSTNSKVVEYKNYLEEGRYFINKGFSTHGDGTSVRIGADNSTSGNIHVITKPIPVKKGDKIKVTGYFWGTYPCIVGYNTEDLNSELEGRLLNNANFLIEFPTTSGVGECEVPIENENINFIRCSSYSVYNNKTYDLTVTITTNEGTSGIEDQGDTPSQSNDVVYNATSYPTKAVVPYGKRILVLGASLANPEVNDWGYLIEKITGIPVDFNVAGGSNVIGNIAAKLMFNKINVDGTTVNLKHGLVFGKLSKSGNSVKYTDNYSKYGLIIINHVLNKNVYSLGFRNNQKVEDWTAQDYENYFTISRGTSSVNPTTDYTLSSLNVSNLNSVNTSNWNLVPKSTTDTTPITDAEAFDYVIKRIKAWNNEYSTNNNMIYSNNNVQILITSHWTFGRPIYNESSRKLCEKHNIAYCELDKMLGFIESDKINDGNNIHIDGGTLFTDDSGTSYSIATGNYNRSVLHAWDTDDNTSTKANYWGRHLKYRSSKPIYDGEPVSINGKNYYIPWIQRAIAHGIVSCLNYIPIVQTN